MGQTSFGCHVKEAGTHTAHLVTARVARTRGRGSHPVAAKGRPSRAFAARATRTPRTQCPGSTRLVVAMEPALCSKLVLISATRVFLWPLRRPGVGAFKAANSAPSILQYASTLSFSHGVSGRPQLLCSGHVSFCQAWIKASIRIGVQARMHWIQASRPSSKQHLVFIRP